MQNLIVTLPRGPDDHLGGLPSRHEFRGMVIHREIVLIGPDPILDLAHGSQNVPPVLVGRQFPQAFRRGQFQVYTHAVR